MLNVEPYSKRQSERGTAWRTVAANLNSNTQEQFRVSDRACRDHFHKIMQEFEKKERDEHKATGIDVEYDELAHLSQDIKDRMEEVTSQVEPETAKKQQEAEQASGMRQKAMETMGGTKKRKSSSTDGKQPQRRRSSDTMNVLQESMQQRAEQMKAERELRERELKTRELEMKQQQQVMMQMLHNQQLMFQQLADKFKST